MVRRRAILLVLGIAVVFLPVASVTAANVVERVAYPAAIPPFLALLVAGLRRRVSQERMELGLLVLGTGLVTVLFWGLLRADSTVPAIVDTGTSFGARNSLMLIAAAFLLLGPRWGVRYAAVLVAVWVALSFLAAGEDVDELLRHVPEFARAFLSTLVTVAVLWGLTLQRVVWSSGHESARAEAEEDQLTGLANRRGLLRHLEELLEDADRGLAVAMVDLDHFKEVNDEHGHDVGDAALVVTADTLRREVRDDDLVARWGGEEFVLVLDGSDRDRAAAAAERCRAAIEAARPRRDDDPWFPELTASFGVAAHRPGDTAEELVARADEQLYRAKEAGRNCVRAAPAGATD